MCVPLCMRLLQEQADANWRGAAHCSRWAHRVDPGRELCLREQCVGMFPAVRSAGCCALAVKASDSLLASTSNIQSLADTTSLRGAKAEANGLTGCPVSAAETPVCSPSLYPLIPCLIFVSVRMFWVLPAGGFARRRSLRLAIVREFYLIVSMLSYPNNEYSLPSYGYWEWAGRCTRAIGHTFGCIRRFPQRNYRVVGLQISGDEVWGALQTAGLVPTTSSSGSGSDSDSDSGTVLIRGVSYSEEGKPIVRTLEFQNRQLE